MLVRFLPFFGVLALAALTACNSNSDQGKPHPVDASASLKDLIPKPVMVTAASGVFSLNDSTVITVAPGNPDLTRVAEYMASVLKPATGFAFKIDGAAGATNSISLALVNDSSLTGEGYELTNPRVRFTLCKH
jgi:hexosaminidase